MSVRISLWGGRFRPEHPPEHGHGRADTGFGKAQQGVQARTARRIQAGGDHHDDHRDRSQAAVAADVGAAQIMPVTKIVRAMLRG